MVGDEMGEKVIAVQFRETELLTEAALRKIFSKILEAGGKIHYHATSNEINIHKLSKDGGQTHGIEVTKEEMRGFDRYAKKYHVWYSMTQEKNDKEQYMFMFKLKDFNRLESAMKDYFKDSRDHTTLREKIEHAREESVRINQAREKEHTRQHNKIKNKGRSVER